MKIEGEPKPKPIKTAGIRDWLIAAEREGVISEKLAQELIEENEAAKRRLLERKLPTFAAYGPCDSFEEVMELIPESLRESEDQRFLVRCAPKDISSELKIERNMDIPWSKVVEFVRSLPGGTGRYTIEVREHWRADYAGAVIGNGEGKVLVEMIEGDLVGLDKKGREEIMQGMFGMGEGSGTHFDYTDGMSREQKEIMLGALMYIIPKLDRESLEKLKIYLEFAYKKEKGYRFIDVSDTDFWTRL